MREISCIYILASKYKHLWIEYRISQHKKNPNSFTARYN